MKARASLPIWLPAADHRVRLKEQEEVMGKGKLEAKGTEGLYCTRDMPWHASLHQLYGFRPPEVRRLGFGVWGLGFRV